MCIYNSYTWMPFYKMNIILQVVIHSFRWFASKFLGLNTFSTSKVEGWLSILQLEFNFNSLNEYNFLVLMREHYYDLVAKYVFYNSYTWMPFFETQNLLCICKLRTHAYCYAILRLEYKFSILLFELPFYNQIQFQHLWQNHISLRTMFYS